MSAYPRFTPATLQPYLQALYGGAVRVVRISALGGGRQGDTGSATAFPLRVDYELEDESRRIVLDSVRPGPFGHEHMADRAQANILFSADADLTLLDPGKLEDDFERLWLRFWERYLERSGDRGMLEVAAPFLASTAWSWRIRSGTRRSTSACGTRC